MKKRVITISRELGSGGNAVGKLVADKLGIKFYNKEIIEQIAEESGFAREFVNKYLENSNEKGLLRYLFDTSYSPNAMKGLNAEDYLWLCQYKIISRIADSPCVIVGRNSDYILHERKDVINVFIHADKTFRIKRISRLYGIGAKAAELKIQEKDNFRRKNYKRYSGQEWGATDNYDICLNTSELGIELCTDIIAKCYNELE